MDAAAARKPLNGNYYPRAWNIKTSTGANLSPGCEFGRDMSRLDFFLLLFPPEQLNIILSLTNDRLSKEQEPLKSKGDM